MPSDMIFPLTHIATQRLSRVGYFLTDAVINNRRLAHNCDYMINSIVTFHYLSRCRVRGHLHLIFGGVQPHRSYTAPLLTFAAFVSLQSKSCFPILATRISQATPSHQYFLIIQEYMEYFFRKELLEVVSEQCITLCIHISYSVSQFLD